MFSQYLMEMFALSTFEGLFGMFLTFDVNVPGMIPHFPQWVHCEYIMNIGAHLK